MSEPRTSFRFDMMPWKLVFCELAWRDCGQVMCGNGVRISDLPDAPEPGRIPKGADHLHIAPKLSGERDAREEEKWRSLMLSTARCAHGKLPGDRCQGCRGSAPSMEGVRVGTTHDRLPVVIPARDDLRDIRNWVER